MLLFITGRHMSCLASHSYHTHPISHTSASHFFFLTMTATAADGDAAPIPSTSTGVGSVFSSYKDAARHVSQAVLDNDTNNAKKCGDLACQHDSFQTQLDDGSILSYAVYEEKPAAAKVTEAAVAPVETKLLCTNVSWMYLSPSA